MKEFLFELEENKIKIYLKDKNEIKPYKIHGEEIIFIESLDDALEVKKIIKREYDNEKIRINIIYNNNISQSFLNLIYLTFLLKSNKNLELDTKILVQAFNKDSMNEIYQIMEQYFNLKTFTIKKEEEPELKEKIENLEKEKKKMKSEARKLKIQIEKEKIEREKEKIINKLNKLGGVSQI